MVSSLNLQEEVKGKEELRETLMFSERLNGAFVPSVHCCTGRARAVFAQGGGEERFCPLTSIAAFGSARVCCFTKV